MTTTAVPDFLSDERFIKEHRKVFAMFMGRDSHSEQMATEEFPRLQQTFKQDGRPNDYLCLQRTGSRFALERREKMEIAEIYHKAGNHAYFGYCKEHGIDPT